MEQLKTVFGPAADLAEVDMVATEETQVPAVVAVAAGMALPVATQPEVAVDMDWGVADMVFRYLLAMNPKIPLISTAVEAEAAMVLVVMALAALAPMVVAEAAVAMKTTVVSAEMVFV